MAPKKPGPKKTEPKKTEVAKTTQRLVLRIGKKTAMVAKKTERLILRIGTKGAINPTQTEHETVALSPPPIPARCFACWKSSKMKCSVCNNSHYCSKVCQMHDENMHQTLCNSFATLEPRPGLNYFRSIFFPPDEQLPRFVWVEYRSAQDPTTILPDKIAGQPMPGHYRIDSLPVLRPARHHLGIYHTVDTFTMGGSSMTPSIENWLGSASSFLFRGPYLAHGYTGDDKLNKEGYWEASGQPCDLDTRDLSYLLGFFEAQGAIFNDQFASKDDPLGY